MAVESETKLARAGLVTAAALADLEAMEAQAARVLASCLVPVFTIRQKVAGVWAATAATVPGVAAVAVVLGVWVSTEALALAEGAVARVALEEKEEAVVELPLALCFIASTRPPSRTTRLSRITVGKAAMVVLAVPEAEAPREVWERLTYAPSWDAASGVAAMAAKAAAVAAAVSVARVGVAGVAHPSESWWGQVCPQTSGITASRRAEEAMAGLAVRRDWAVHRVAAAAALAAVEGVVPFYWRRRARRAPAAKAAGAMRSMIWT